MCAHGSHTMHMLIDTFNRYMEPWTQDELHGLGHRPWEDAKRYGSHTLTLLRSFLALDRQVSGQSG